MSTNQTNSNTTPTLVSQMGVPKQSSENSWEPTVTADTATIGYWCNWKVLVCALWALIIISFASFLVWKYENIGKPRRRRREIGGDETQEQETAACAPTLYDDDTWTPCLRGLHPAWLLGFRIVAFSLLFAMLIVTVLVDGPSIYCYYTEWTSTLITVYFALGATLSVRGCLKHHNRAGGDKVTNLEVDPEQGIPASLPISKNPTTQEISAQRVDLDREIAGFWGYTFQIIFQVNAGAVVLTDCVFWFIIAPFLMIKNYNLSFLDINMHTINVILLLGDTVLNSLHFPLFRIAYFFLWTIAFVAFQWILHASFNLWWPYPFLDLSSQYAPLWYLCVALMHFPCYGIFALVVKLKHILLKRWFPHSYHFSTSR